ncbi:MAG TPA: glycosyltransferase [Candidatus Latescibacteria bacterium]|nr:glycosyltransferase [Candidatus Latescibacterota bacterium]
MKVRKFDATVVIPVYNIRQVLKRTLAGILDQDYPNYEVVVVDDGSTDGTEELFSLWRPASEALGSGLLKYVKLTQNRGRAAARNEGIRRAGGEVIIFLDGDNVPCRRFVAEHLLAHRRWTGIVTVGNVELSEELLGSRFARFWNRRYVGNRRGLDLNDLPFYFPGTSNGSVRREDLLRAGCFDEEFRHYGGEDEDLWYRLCVLMGLRNVFVRGAVTVHSDPGFSYPRSLERIRTYSRCSVPVLLRKHPGYLNTGIFIRLLEPLDIRKDRPSDLPKKALLALATSGPWIGWIEKATFRWEFGGPRVPGFLYGLVLCRHYRAGVRERKALLRMG